jgi:lon-related putative ATP-dependent protease
MAKRRRTQALSIKSLPAAALRPTCDPKTLGFKSTTELEPIDTLIGQDRALGAVRFGTGIDRPGYNMFVLGPQGSGRHTAILSYLGQKAQDAPAPDDWVYVHNFASTHRPQAIRLPAGIAVPFRDAMAELVDDLRNAIPTQFQSDEYREKRRAIDAEFEETQERAFDDLRQKAEAQQIGILRTPMGFALAPLQDGQVVKPEVFNALPEEQRKLVEDKISVLQTDLTAMLERFPLLEKRRREQVRKLNAELTGMVVDASIKAVADQFAGIEAIQRRLIEIREDLVHNVELFLPQEDTEARIPLPQKPETRTLEPQFNRYLVNVMITNDNDGDKLGAPLVCEDHPTLSNLVGRIEHQSQFGALVTDFTMIRPGALHRANGGYLVIDARKVLTEMFSWEALKRALRGNSITIVSAAEQLSLVSTTSLEPEPIPLKVKVVLIGERILYYLLSTLDPDFDDLFKVEVDFEQELTRSPENVALYARLIATIAKNEKLRPLNAPAVARLIDETARLAEDAERLSLRIGRLADLLREADYWASEAKRRHIAIADINKAVDEQIQRADRIRDHSHEIIERGIILIDTDGEAVGQINGLSVIGLGNFSFGRPARITARVRMGSGKVIDIERETKLGGPLHSKGVLILSSFLAANYALDVPMSLWASLVFEQSYGGVDGDSASSAELYALLSALAGVPLKQSLAVTGSINQNGQVQAIGGVNQKIEGFYDVCSAQGLTGDQGVLIPSANVAHLMLRPDIVKASAKGKFQIYPVDTIAQGIELLTGMPAGKRGSNGQFPEGTVNALVEARLGQFANKRKQFGGDDRERHEPGEAAWH